MELNSNEILARCYFSMASQYCDNREFGKLRRKKEIIEDYDVDIGKYFESRGNIRKLGIKGLGIETVKDLELILSKGIDVAKKIFEERNTKKLNGARYFGVDNSVNLNRDNLPSNDNVSKVCENR